MKLDNKVAVITGGAMGNGLGIVKTFLKYGAKVAILDYSEQIFNTINELANPNVLGFKVDIRDKDVVEECIGEVVKTFGNIDILVNNAGVCKLVKFEDMSDEDRDFHFDINIIGTWNVTKACLPYMKNHKCIYKNNHKNRYSQICQKQARRISLILRERPIV